MSNYFLKNMQALMEKWNATPYTLAPHLGTEPSTIYRWLNPDLPRVPRSRMRVTIGEFFGVDPNELVDGLIDVNNLEAKNTEQKALVKRSYRGKRIPLVTADKSLLLAGLLSDDIESYNGELWPGAKEWLPAAPDLDLPQDRLVAMRHSGAAMSPTIENGDLVYIDFVFSGDMEVPDFKEGDLVLAEPATPETNKSNAPVIRKLVYGDNEEDRWLTATNPDFPGTRTVKARDILGKVVAIFRKL